MAVTFDRRLGEYAGTGDVFLNSVSLTAGEFVVAWVACDNTAGTDQPGISLVKHGGVSQAYTVVASHAAANTSAGGATRGFIIIVPAISATATGLFEVTFTAIPAKSTAVVAVFDGVSTTVGHTAQASATPGGNLIFSETGAGIEAGELLLVLTSCENSAAMTMDTDTTNGAWVQPGGDGSAVTSGGGAAANVAMMAAYKIPTAQGAQQWLATGSANDGGACGVALAATPTGPVTVPVTGALAVTATLTAAAVGTPRVAGALAVTATLTAAAAITAIQTIAGALPVTATLTAAATSAKTVGGSLAVTATLGAAAARAAGVSGSLAVTATTTGTAGRTATVAATSPFTATLSAGAAVTMRVGGSLAITATRTATATAGTPITGGLVVNVGLTAAVRRTSAVGGSLAVTATTTAAANTQAPSTGWANVWMGDHYEAKPAYWWDGADWRLAEIGVP